VLTQTFCAAQNVMPAGALLQPLQSSLTSQPLLQRLRHCPPQQTASFVWQRDWHVFWPETQTTSEQESQSGSGSLGQHVP
jgi:hypothetical protein